MTGGGVELQNFENLSRRFQLWWRGARDGDKLVLQLEVPRRGRWRLVAGVFCQNADYGDVTLGLGSIQRRISFRAPQLAWGRVDLGHTLPLRGRPATAHRIAHGTRPGGNRLLSRPRFPSPAPGSGLSARGEISTRSTRPRAGDIREGAMKMVLRNNDRAVASMLLAMTMALVGTAEAMTWHVAPREARRPAPGRPGPHDLGGRDEGRAGRHGRDPRGRLPRGRHGRKERHEGESDPLPGRARRARRHHRSADAIRAWVEEPGGGTAPVLPWPHRFIGWNRSGTHPDDVEHKMIGRCEQVFILGYPLLQVLDRSGLGRGTFYVDLDA